MQPTSQVKKVVTVFIAFMTFTLNPQLDFEQV